jgi:hypothetical protein
VCDDLNDAWHRGTFEDPFGVVTSGDLVRGIWLRELAKGP